VENSISTFRITGTKKQYNRIATFSALAEKLRDVSRVIFGRHVVSVTVGVGFVLFSFV